jgi:hypothetical protein
VHCWIDAPRAAADELDAEDEPGVTERDKREGDRSAVAAKEQCRDDCHDGEKRPVCERAAERGPGIAEKAIADEQRAGDAEREDVGKRFQSKPSVPLRADAARHDRELDSEPRHEESRHDERTNGPRDDVEVATVLREEGSREVLECSCHENASVLGPQAVPDGNTALPREMKKRPG